MGSFHRHITTVFLPPVRYRFAHPDGRITEPPLNALVVGAHVDGCHITRGTAAKYTAHGHGVPFVSVIDVEVGHHEIGALERTRRRRIEGPNRT